MGKRLVRAAHPPENGAVDCHGARATATLLQNWRFRSNVSPINCRGILLLIITKLFDIDTLMVFATDPQSHLHLLDSGSPEQLKEALHRH